MRIGDLAKATGASVRALRYYEEQGLLESERSASGQRVYAEHAVDRVLWIRHLLSARLPSRTILKLKPCNDSGDITAEERALVAAERAKVDEQIRSLTAVRDRLDAMMDYGIADERTCVHVDRVEVREAPDPVLR
ncbi:MerR family transcriptional regulator [Glycomyces sp. NPDC048151]|uniref:MerR family transcriptional regulator n=1 Tax=Glycomyces sp. NPDC048151 TaxID=3364002 RepID=UPI003713B6D9